MNNTKRYKCPYCDKRPTREQMIGHIERLHYDLLPEGFSPLRMTFHIVNKRDIKYRRPCRICHKGTHWDEKKGRYDFLCGSKSCHDSWVQNMDITMGDKKGAFRPTSTPEGLEKMLSARKISNKYKWSDGTIKTYVGSYEGNTLKFMDKIMNCKSEDVQCPGPILEYYMDDKKHYYMTDIYFIPYRLIIEVKDGGSNPNTNPSLSETRRKSVAKEEHVIKNTDYNYLKLTDNDLSQLLAVFADLKMHLIDKDISRVIHVNENMTPMDMAPIVGTNDIVVVQYKANNTFAGDSDFAISDSIKFDTVFLRNSVGELKKTTKTIFENCDYTPYLVKDIKDKISPIIKENLNKFVPNNFIYETVFGHELYSEDQIIFENNAIEIIDFYKEQSNIHESVERIIKDDTTIVTESLFNKSKSKTDIFLDTANKWLNSIGYHDIIFKICGGFKRRFNTGKINKMAFVVSYKKIGNNFNRGKKDKDELKKDRLYLFIQKYLREDSNLEKFRNYMNSHTDLDIKRIQKPSSPLGAYIIIFTKR